MTGQQYQTQQTLSVPGSIPNTQRNLTTGGIQTAGSFHSISSLDASAEMAKYFPDAQTPAISPAIR